MMVNSTDSSGSTRRLMVLAAVCVAALALPLTFSAGAVATPAIGRDLSGGAVEMNWITNAFMLAFGSLLMAMGTLADRFGRKRLFTYGVAAFVLTSLALGFAPSIVVVDLMRAAQGIAAAAALAGGTAALAQEFDGHARTRAFSALGTTFGLGLAFGPVLAGWLISACGWRAIFATGALSGALSLIFGVPRMRESRDPHARQLDWAGTASFTIALACFTWGVIDAPSHGWTSPRVITLLAVCIASMLVFVAVETRAEHPMLDLSLFRYPRFIGVQVLPIATCYCYVVLLVVLPLRFIGIDGYDAIHAGWLMLALSAPMLIVPFVAATLTRWISSGVISGLGLLIAAAGLHALHDALRAGAGSTAIVPMLVIGIGAGLPWGLMDGLSVSVVPKSRAGMATGIFSTTRVAGEGVALAIVNALLAAFIQNGLQAAAPNVDPMAITEAATRLAAGDFLHAAPRLPEVSHIALQISYYQAFGRLLDGLTIITLLSALAAFAFLSRVRMQDEPVATRPENLPAPPTVDGTSQIPEYACEQAH